MSAFAKSGDAWRDGEAIYYALEIDQLATPFGSWLAERPIGLLRGLTWGVLALEFAAAPAILSPFFQPALRRTAIVMLAGMHLGTGLAMVLGWLPATMIATYALLLRSEDWKLLERARPRLARALGPVAERLRDLVRSVVPPPPPPVSSPIPGRIGRVLREGAVAIVFVAVLVDSVNINMIDRLGIERISEPRWMQAIIQAPQLVHDWKLFAPYPSRDDGWWVIDGVTVSGRSVDPMTGRAPTFEKPHDLSRRVGVWWRKYLHRIWLREFAAHRVHFARFVTRSYRRANPDDPLDNFKLYYVEERTLPPGTPKPFPVRRVLLWSHDCFLGDPNAPAERPPTRPNLALDQTGESESQAKRSGSPS
jgi:hypothetical protein